MITRDDRSRTVTRPTRCTPRRPRHLGSFGFLDSRAIGKQGWPVSWTVHPQASAATPAAATHLVGGAGRIVAAVARRAVRGHSPALVGSLMTTVRAQRECRVSWLECVRRIESHPIGVKMVSMLKSPDQMFYLNSNQG